MIDKNLWRQGKNHKAYLVATIVSGLLCAVTILWQAYLLAHIVYLVFIEGWTLDSLWRDLSLLILAMSVRAMLSWAEEWFSLRLAVLVQQDLRGALVAKIDALGPLALGD